MKNISIKNLAKYFSKISIAIVDQGFFSLANFIVSIQLARYMCPDDYGSYSYIFSIFFLLSSFYNVLLLEPMSIFGPVRYRDRLSSYFMKLLRLHIGWSVVIFILVMLIVVCSFLCIKQKPRLIGGFLGFGISQGMILYFLFVRRFMYLEGRLYRALMGTILYTFLLIIGTWVLYATNKVTPFSAFLVNGLAALVAGGNPRILIQQSKQSFNLDRDTSNIFSENWKYGRWLLLSSLMYWMTGNAYYVLTANMLSLSDTAALRALQNLTNPVLQVVTAIGLLFMPWISKQFAEYGISSLKKGIMLFSTVATGLALVSMIIIVPLADILIQVIYQGRYAERIDLLPYLALVPVMMGLTSGWLLGLRILGRTSSIFIVDIVGTGLTITAGVALVNSMGLKGAAIGTVISTGGRLIILPLLWRNKI